MSEFMLSDQDAINDVNPFVSRDFSLPGGVRQTGDFEDFQEVRPVKKVEASGSVFCEYGLCSTEKEGDSRATVENIHPRRNIDCGVAPKKIKSAPTPTVTVSVGEPTAPMIGMILCIIIMVYLGLLYAKR
jgi:hypothetical protein